jgi:hypothetical protein
MRWLRWALIVAGFLLVPGELADAAYVPFPGPQCTQQLNVSQITSTDLKTFTNGVHICFVFLVSATTQQVTLIAGTGTVCGTTQIALMGSTTVTGVTGLNLAANEGFVLGTGFYPIAETATTAQHLCLMQSSTGQISGIIRYIDQ